MVVIICNQEWMVGGRKEGKGEDEAGRTGWKDSDEWCSHRHGLLLFVHVSIMNAGLPLHLLFLAFCLSSVSGGTINLCFVASTNFYLSAPLVARFSRCSHFCFTANQ